MHAIGLKMGPKDKTLVSSETTSEDKKVFVTCSNKLFEKLFWKTNYLDIVFKRSRIPLKHK